MKKLLRNVYEAVTQPEQNNSLQEVLREGARKMLAAAIESEVTAFIKQHGCLKTDELRFSIRCQQA